MGSNGQEYAHSALLIEKDRFRSEGSPSAANDFHILQRFDNYANEHHQCGFCPRGVGAYYYCKTCFPDGRPTHAACNPSVGRDCFAKHVAGHAPTHSISLGIKKKAAVRSSPQRAANRAAQQAQRNAHSEPARPAARRL